MREKGGSDAIPRPLCIHWSWVCTCLLLPRANNPTGVCTRCARAFGTSRARWSRNRYNQLVEAKGFPASYLLPLRAIIHPALENSLPPGGLVWLQRKMPSLTGPAVAVDMMLPCTGDRANSSDYHSHRRGCGVAKDYSPRLHFPVDQVGPSSHVSCPWRPHGPWVEVTQTTDPPI